MELSNHFRHSLKLLGASVLLLLGVFFWFKHKLAGVLPGLNPPRHYLPSNIKERLHFDEKTHVITITTHTKTLRAYARNPTVSITNTGDIILGKHLTGLENDWFMGVGYADCGRIFVGDNLYYLGRFDLFGTLGFVPDTTKTFARAYVGIGYNVWSNTSINIAVNPVDAILSYHPEVAGFVSVRF